MAKALVLMFLIGLLLVSTFSATLSAVLLILAGVVIYMVAALISKPQNDQLILLLAFVAGVLATLLIPGLRAESDPVLLALFALVLSWEL